MYFHFIWIPSKSLTVQEHSCKWHFTVKTLTCSGIRAGKQPLNTTGWMSEYPSNCSYPADWIVWICISIQNRRGLNYKWWDKPDVVNLSLRLIWTDQKLQQDSLRTEFTHKDFINLYKKLGYSAEYSLNPANTQHSYFLCSISKATWRTKQAFSTDSSGWWLAGGIGRNIGIFFLSQMLG